MKIDAHQHFWTYNTADFGWITDDMKPIQRSFLPQDLEPLLNENQMDGCVLVQVNQNLAENDTFLGYANQNQFIKGVVGWVDLMDDQVEAQLVQYAQHAKFKGVRHIVQAETNGFMERKDFQHGISKLAQFGLTYDILISAEQLPEAMRLVEKFPDQPFVLDHMAKPQFSNGLDRKWVNDIWQLAQQNNVYCKISGMVTETIDFKWKSNDFTPFLDVVVEAFGMNRLMFGSDWPVCLVAASYARTIDIVSNYFSKFSKDDQEKVMGKNAIQFYRLL